MSRNLGCVVEDARGASEERDAAASSRDLPPKRRLRQLATIELSRLSRVGPKRLSGLAEMGMESVLDLITHYPRRYLDRSAQQPIRQLTPGTEALVLGSIKRIEARKSRQGRTFVEAVIFDGSGYLKATFFNQAWRVKQLLVGTDVAFFGKVDLYRDERRMTNPVVDLVGNKTGKIVPLYPQSDKAGLTTWEISDWIEEALERAGDFVEPLAEHWRHELDLVGRTWAMRQIHVPESMGAAQAARKRLAFDELLRMQLLLVMRKRAVERDSQGILHAQATAPGHGRLVEQFHRSLPFALTGAQQRAIAQISLDLASPLPMHRLLQGDVGAGKTLVAVTAALMAIQDGTQAALMAPTEVLAEQHEIGIRMMLDRAQLEVEAPDRLGGVRPVSVRLLTNRTTAAERRELHAALLTGDVDFLIGTHALLTDIVAFKQLGLVVIDEQHRFGVEQRAVLKAKGNGLDPDMLVMTATPIPRTAAMTVYGDLDSTILDELPPGRTPIVTTWARSEMESSNAFAHVVEHGFEAGHLFLFFNRRRDSVKILLWEGDGFAIFYKRLEIGTFAVPQAGAPRADGSVPAGVEILASDLKLILGGVDPARVPRRPRFQRKTA